MTEVDGVVSVGEFQAAQRAYVRRIWGAKNYWLPVIRGVLFLLVIPIAAAATTLARGNGALGGILGVLAAGAYIVAYSFGYARWARWMARRVARRFGFETDHRMTIRAEDHALIACGSGWSMEVCWSSIVEVVQTKAVWVFAGNWSTVYLPRRFFPDLAAEREFMKFVTEHLGAAARGRSASISSLMNEVA